jgi:hypothetical protein
LTITKNFSISSKFLVALQFSFLSINLIIIIIEIKCYFLGTFIMNKVYFISAPYEKPKEIQNQDIVLPSRIDSLFQEFKQLVQDIPIKALPLLSEEVEYVNQMIDKLRLDPNLKPTANRNETTLHPKAQEFINRFSLLGLEEKIVLMQYLSNARYKNHEIYYFMPSFLLAKDYPKLKEYINYRDFSVERILTPKGIRFAIDLWKSAGKLSSQVECIACEDVDCLKEEIQKVDNSLVNVQKLFLVQMDQTDSLRGDHTIPIFINKEIPENRMEVIITDSVGTSRKFLDVMSKFVYSLLPKADIRGFAHPRQTNSHSCLLFALNDARVICQNPKKFISFVRSQETKSVQDSPYKVFDALPDEMMKLSQTTSALMKILNETNFSDLACKLRRKGVLILHKEDQDSSLLSRINEWKQKGVLMTDKQLSRETNIYANYLFTKIERKILENAFFK